MYISETTVRVRYSETDAMGMVYHGHYAAFFEVARVEAFRKLGLSYREIEAMGIIMPVVEWHARFIRPARYDDLLTIKTILKQNPLEHRMELFQEVYNESGVQLTSGRVVLYILNAGTMERTTLPEQIAEKLKPFFMKEDADL